MLKAQLASEKEASSARIEEREASAREAARTAEAKQIDMQDDIMSLQEQVWPLPRCGVSAYPVWPVENACF